MDTLVFDIETQNFFTDPGVGWDNFAALKISVVGVYSYMHDKYFAFDEYELEKAADLFKTARKIVGFSMNRYDVPVLDRHFKRLSMTTPDIWEKERVDLLEEVEAETGQRISLSRLAAANLGVKKDMHGSAAIGLYKEGKLDELKEYCLNDVKLTKEIYDIFRKKGELLVPERDTGELKTVKFAREYVTLF
ncbi:MAG: ribonuclease H-like domain-containing protein [Patescibacteria group bacterium]